MMGAGLEVVGRAPCAVGFVRWGGFHRFGPVERTGLDLSFTASHQTYNQERLRCLAFDHAPHQFTGP